MAIHATVIGRLTRDPERRAAGSSTVYSCNMAVDKFDRGQKGTDFVRVSIWGKRGEQMVDMLSKGQMACFRGVMTQREYEQNGEKRTSLELKADDFDLIGGGVRDNKPQESQQAPSAEQYDPWADEA